MYVLDEIKNNNTYITYVHVKGVDRDDGWEILNVTRYVGKLDKNGNIALQKVTNGSLKELLHEELDL